MSTIPKDAYTFVDYYYDGVNRLKMLMEDIGYVVVADIYTFGLPLHLVPFANYGWTSLDGMEEKYSEEYGRRYIQLPIPTENVYEKTIQEDLNRFFRVF